jgi:predicted HTH transcriptional regulator
MADLKALIEQGEGISIEFKECRRTINRNVYETVCAFLNRHGGDLLLGVSDAGKVTGVDPDCVEQIKRDFVTAINNPQKINLKYRLTGKPYFTFLFRRALRYTVVTSASSIGMKTAIWILPITRAW